MVNLIVIAISSAIVFYLLGFHQMRWIEKKEIDKEKEESAEEKDDTEMNDKPTLMD